MSSFAAHFKIVNDKVFATHRGRRRCYPSTGIYNAAFQGWVRERLCQCSAFCYDSRHFDWADQLRYVDFTPLLLKSSLLTLIPTSLSYRHLYIYAGLSRVVTSWFVFLTDGSLDGRSGCNSIDPH